MQNLKYQRVLNFLDQYLMQNLINYNINIPTKTSERLRKVLSQFHTRSFLLTQLLNELSYPFHLTYNWSPFLLITFFHSKFFLIYFLQFFFIKCFSNGFTIQVTNIIISWSCILNSTNKKTSSDQFWIYPLAKILFYFDTLTRSPALYLGSFSLESSLYSV